MAKKVNKKLVDLHTNWIFLLIFLVVHPIDFQD